jgi:hypothetical protein
MTNTTIGLSTLALAGLAIGLLYAAEPPNTVITNGQIKAKIYLPDSNNGFYRSTRFDWSGVIGSLEYKGHVFYGPWYYKIDPSVYDFNYDDQGVVSAPFTAMVGPGEEFNTDGAALGFAEAKPGAASGAQSKRRRSRRRASGRTRPLRSLADLQDRGSGQVDGEEEQGLGGVHSCTDQRS